MRKLITLLILFVATVSLCSELPIQLPFSLPNVPSGTTQGAATIDSQDIYVNVETLSSDIRSERSVQFFFEIRNKQLYDLENVYFEVYDHPCFSESGDNSGKFTKNNCTGDGILKSNQSCSWSWRWTADSTDADKTCQIRFMVKYNAKNSVYQDIVVLPETEYNQREVDGTLNSIPIQFTSAKGPLNVYLTFSESQPFIAGQSGYNMYINYNNLGDGFFDSLNDKIILNSTDNIDLECGDYSGTGTLTLNKDLTFIKGRAVRSICSFNTSPVSTINIRSLNIEIDYNYTLYTSFPITVRGLS